MGVGRVENLIPTTALTEEERRAMASRAGKASVESRRRRKTFAEGLKQLLAMPVDDPARLKALKDLGLDGTFQDSINLAQIANAQKGDTEAARFVRDTVGEKPRDGLEIGNLDDKPLACVDMSKLTDEQLRELVTSRSDEG